MNVRLTPKEWPNRTDSYCGVVRFELVEGRIVLFYQADRVEFRSSDYVKFEIDMEGAVS